MLWEKLALKFGSYILVILIGFAAGEHFATKSVIDRVQRNDAKNFADATGSLYKDWGNSNQKLSQHLASDAKKSAAADDHAIAKISTERDAARADADKARSDLARYRATHPTQPKIMEAANACPAPEPFTFGPDARRLLDNAAGASTNGPAAPTGRSGTETASGMLDGSTAR